jgi:hypothetical protein
VLFFLISPQKINLEIFCGVFCGSQQGEFKNTKTKLGGVHVKNFWPKKLRKNTFFMSSFPIGFFYRVLAVSLHEEPKNTIKIFSKSDLKISKHLKKRQVGKYVAFFF